MPALEDLVWFALGFVPVAAPSCIAIVKFMECYSAINERLDEQQQRLRQSASRVVDANERLYGAGFLSFVEEDIRSRGLPLTTERSNGEQASRRKWDV